MTALRRAGRAILGPNHYDEVDIAVRLLPQSDGFMVDVGAHRGSAHAALADRGWEVLALEPDPANRRYLDEAAHPNVTIDARAITGTDGERLTLYTSEVSSGISTLAPFHESHHASVEVETVRLDTLLAGQRRVDFLKVDTEGFDLRVLQTFPWDEQLPTVVLCEFEDRKTVPLGYTYPDLADFLVERGYVVLMSEWFPIVEYGGKHRWRRVVRYPAAVADPQAWGNFIAVRPDRASRALRVARGAGRQLGLRRVAERVLRRG